jgi:hypothetical protein
MNLELKETVSPLKSVLLVPCVVYLAAVNMDSKISPRGAEDEKLHELSASVAKTHSNYSPLGASYGSREKCSSYFVTGLTSPPITRTVSHLLQYVAFWGMKNLKAFCQSLSLRSSL